MKGMRPEQWIEHCAGLATDELWSGLARLHREEASALCAILAHLGELDHRDAALDLASPSLFAYCTKKLGYSEAEAFLRIRCARAARRFPRILRMLDEREIHVAAVAKLWPHLTSDNYRSLLGKASRRSLEELDRLVASLAPRPERRPVIRTLSTGSDAPPPMARADGELPLSVSAPVGQSRAAAQGRVLFSFVAGEALRAKFKRARDLLRHKHPRGLPEEIFDDALEALLDRKDPDRRIARLNARALLKLSSAGAPPP